MANNTVGRINVVASLATRPFTKGADRVKRDTSVMAKTVRRAGGIIAGFGIAAGVAAGTGLAAMTRESMRTIDEQAKFARRLGTSVQSLRELEFAAGQSGVGVSQLRMGMQRMTRRVAEAAQGTGEARKAIAELGLDAGRLAQMTPDQQMMVFADALAGVEQQSERVRLAFKLFDSEGVALLQLLQQGSQRTGALRADFRALSGVITDLEANSIEAANDAVDRMGTAFDRIGREIAVSIAPAVEALADAFTGVEHAADGAGRAAERGFLSRMSRSLGIAAADSIRNVSAMFSDDRALAEHRAAQRMMADVMRSAGIRVDDASRGDAGGDVDTEAMQTTKRLAAEQADRMAELERVAERVRSSVRTPLQEINAEYEQLRAVFAEGLIDRATFDRAERALRERYESLSRAVEASPLRDAAERIRGTIETPIDELERRMAELDKVFASGLLSGDEYERARRSIRGDFVGDAQRMLGLVGRGGPVGEDIGAFRQGNIERVGLDVRRSVERQPEQRVAGFRELLDMVREIKDGVRSAPGEARAVLA